MSKTFNFSSNELLEPLASEPKLSGFSQQDVFVCLYHAYVDRIHRYVHFRVPDTELAEDITAQIFLEVWEKLPTYQAGKSPIIAWLYNIAHNTFISYCRAKKILIPLDEANLAEIGEEDGIDENPGLQIKPAQLSMGLQELTNGQQQGLILKLIRRLSTAEIAGPLDKPQGAIRALQMRELQDCPDVLLSKESKYTSIDSVFSLLSLTSDLKQ